MSLIVRAIVAVLVGVVVAIVAGLLLALIPGDQTGWAGAIGLIAAILYFVSGYDSGRTTRI